MFIEGKVDARFWPEADISTASALGPVLFSAFDPRLPFAKESERPIAAVHWQERQFWTYSLASVVCPDYSRSTSQGLQPLQGRWRLVFARNSGFGRCYAERLSCISTTKPREQTMLQLE